MSSRRWLAPWVEQARETGELCERPAIYHCVSRVVDRRFIFGDVEKAQFLKIMRLYERFCGVTVLSYCLMSNHFHMLVEVPSVAPGLSDDELLERLSLVQDDWHVGQVRKALEEQRACGNTEGAEEIHARYTYRFCDLSEFMKTVKQRFTRWYNRRNARKGTLWEDRFKSVLVEDGYAARVMAAYIDLNPVRAGIVDDPKDYRWSSYGEAVAGGKKAREGLERVMAEYSQSHGQARVEKPWRSIAGAYRLILFGDGEERREHNPQTLREEVKRKGVKAAAKEKEEKRRGQLSRAELLRCRVRYFVGGVAIGSKAFVEDYFKQSPGQFGPKRKTGARPLRGTSQKDLYALRDLGKVATGGGE